ncbi:MAG: hypothetical protein K0U98_27245 [Deltaproteobacteria bacterium]|nr:hypothetical protein [Deltaproteobacteria bacterium]
MDRPRWRSTFYYRLHQRFQVGVEYNPAASEFSPLGTLFLLTETEQRPALFLGTSSDRIGSPEGTQSTYLTASKHHPRWPISAYISINYSEWDGGVNIPFGIEVELPKGFSVRPMYDGQRTHLTFNYGGQHIGASLLWVWLERVGVAVSWRF